MSHNRRRGQGFHAASLEHSIHDEHASTDRRARSMRRLAVGDLVAHPGPQHEGAAIPKVCEQFALQAVHDVAFGTPVIRDVAGRVLYDSDSKVATLKRSPGGRALWPGCSEPATSAQSVISNGIFANFIVLSTFESLLCVLRKGSLPACAIVLLVDR